MGLIHLVLSTDGQRFLHSGTRKVAVLGVIKMYRFTAGILLTVLLFFPVSTLSGADLKTLAGPDAFECVFPSKTFGYWNSGSVYTGITEPPSDPETVRIVIRSIDIEEGTAFLKSVWDAQEVTILDNMDGLTFLDVSPLGYVRIVTIFPHYCDVRHAFCSVLSEHVGRYGSTAPYQAFGFCEPR
jgi:hypothetical protein